MDAMPKKFPPEFKRDVVTVARRGDLTVTEVAADFDISVESVRRWTRQADIDDGIKDGLTTAEQSELVQLRRGAGNIGTRSGGRDEGEPQTPWSQHWGPDGVHASADECRRPAAATKPLVDDRLVTLTAVSYTHLRAHETD